MCPRAISANKDGNTELRITRETSGDHGCRKRQGLATHWPICIYCNTFRTKMEERFCRKNKKTRKWKKI